MDLTGPVTDLGRIPVDVGTEVRVHPRSAAGTPRSGLAVAVYSLDPPRYGRSSRSGPGETCVVRGLGAGRFQVMIRPDGAPGVQPRAQEITADGRTAVDLDFDLP